MREAWLVGLLMIDLMTGLYRIGVIYPKGPQSNALVPADAGQVKTMDDYLPPPPH
jgi:hypothetical protein